MKFDDPIRSVLDRKGTDVYSIGPEASVYHAVAKMASQDIGALLVTQHGRIVGILSERDYSRKVALLGRSSQETSVEEVMSPPACVRPTDSVDSCLHLMTSARLRHLAVVDAGEIVGVVSIGDLVNWMISTQADTIHHLNKYIASEYPG